MSMPNTHNTEPFTIEVVASELPEALIAKFAKRPPSDARLSVTVEPTQTEAKKLTALRRDMQGGLADIKESRISDIEAVFARLKSQFPGV